jgi:ubiquitin-activating enzyme E1
LTFLSLLDLLQNHNDLPEWNQNNYFSEFENIFTSHSNNLKEFLSEENEDCEYNFQNEISRAKAIFKYCKLSLSPFCTYLGGIIAQEVLKYSGLFLPLNQWYHYDIYELVPNEYQDKIQHSTELEDNMFKDQIIIFGKAVQEKLFNSK